jgi:hypothetical protein
MALASIQSAPIPDLLDANVLARWDNKQGNVGPCPFQGSVGESVVYAQRHAACRMHMNLDDDELL